MGYQNPGNDGEDAARGGQRNALAKDHDAQGGCEQRADAAGDGVDQGEVAGAVALAQGPDIDDLEQDGYDQDGPARGRRRGSNPFAGSSECSGRNESSAHCFPCGRGGMLSPD